MSERRAYNIKCEHKSAAAQVHFDEVAAKGLSEHEVRKRWPRFDGECPDCKQRVIIYDTFSHYIAGDW